MRVCAHTEIIRLHRVTIFLKSIGFTASIFIGCCKHTVVIIIMHAIIVLLQRIYKIKPFQTIQSQLIFIDPWKYLIRLQHDKKDWFSLNRLIRNAIRSYNCVNVCCPMCLCSHMYRFRCLPTIRHIYCYVYHSSFTYIQEQNKTVALYILLKHWHGYDKKKMWTNHNNISILYIHFVWLADDFLF